MTKLRDPTSAAGAFGTSVFKLPLDESAGDEGMERATRELGKTDKTIYKWLDPEGGGPPVAAAEVLDDIHRRAAGIEHNLDAWMERRARRVSGTDGEVQGPDLSHLLSRIDSDMETVTKALDADRGDAQDVLRQAVSIADRYAALQRAIIDLMDRQDTTRNRRAENRRPFRPTQGTVPKLVCDGGGER